MTKKKTLKTLLKKRDADICKLAGINKQIEAIIWDTKVSPLYELGSRAIAHENKDVIDVHITNGSFFCINWKGHTMDINATPSDFRRFIAGCMELYMDYSETQKKKEKIEKLKKKKYKIDSQISKIK